MADLGRHLDAVQQHVGGAEQVRELLLLDAVEGALQGLAVLHVLHVLGAHVLDGAGEEAAGAAGGVEDGLAQPGVDHVHHELGDGPRGVELARVAGALQVPEDLLVDVVEGVAVGGAVEVDLVELVDDLAHQGAGLHVVVGVLEDALDHAGALGMAA